MTHSFVLQSSLIAWIKKQASMPALQCKLLRLRAGVVGDHHAVADLHARTRIVIEAHVTLFALILIGDVVSDGLGSMPGQGVTTMFDRGVGRIVFLMALLDFVAGKAARHGAAHG